MSTTQYHHDSSNISQTTNPAAAIAITRQATTESTSTLPAHKPLPSRKKAKLSVETNIPTRTTVRSHNPLQQHALICKRITSASRSPTPRSHTSNSPSSHLEPSLAMNPRAQTASSLVQSQPITPLLCSVLSLHMMPVQRMGLRSARTIQ